VSQKLDHLEIRRFIAKRYKARGLNDVVKAIQGIVRTDAADPNVIKLARQITSGTVDFVADPRTGDQTAVVKAWGRYYRAPDSICRTRDDACELEALWDFVVQNCRYVFDHPHVDTYPDIHYTLEAGSEDCFALDTKIIVRSRATACYELRTLRELKNIWPAYEALSYDFTNAKWVFKAITGWKHKGTREVMQSTLGNGPPFVHTPNHKVWWWDGSNVPSTRKIVEHELGSEKDERSYHRRVLVATKIPALNATDIDQSHAYLAGIYAAEGSHDSVGRISIAQDKPIIRERIEKALAEVGASYRFTAREHSNAYYVHTSDAKGGEGAGLRSWLTQGGANSFDMGVPPDIFGASEEVVRTVMQAHADGDAYIPKPGSPWADKVKAIHATSSDRLAAELQLMAMITGEPWNTWLQVDHQGQGRSPIHRFHRYLDGPGRKVSNRQIPELPGVGYSPVQTMNPAGEQEVADISVADTHNFVLSNGLIAHNCDGMAIMFCGLAMAIGFDVAVRIISQDGSQWQHIYALVGLPKTGASHYFPLDATEPGREMGWEFESPAARIDYRL
jgi:hypothetical protein